MNQPKLISSNQQKRIGRKSNIYKTISRKRQQRKSKLNITFGSTGESTGSTGSQPAQNCLLTSWLFGAAIWVEINMANRASVAHAERVEESTAVRVDDVDKLCISWLQTYGLHRPLKVGLCWIQSYVEDKIRYSNKQIEKRLCSRLET